MSVHAISWVLRHSDESVPGRRLVLLVLADKADDDGTNAYPSVATIARETRMSERGVQYALRALEADGRIKKLGTHPTYGTTEYRVLMGGGATIAPVQRQQGCNLRQGGVQSATEPGAQIAPEPSLKQPSIEPSTSARAREAVAEVYEAWLTATNRDPAKTKLTPDRKTCIQRALKEYEPAECLAAVRNIGACVEARNGYGKPGHRYDDIKHALGSGERIERWRDWKAPQRGATPATFASPRVVDDVGSRPTGSKAWDATEARVRMYERKAAEATDPVDVERYTQMAAENRMMIEARTAP